MLFPASSNVRLAPMQAVSGPVQGRAEVASAQLVRSTTVASALSRRAPASSSRLSRSISCAHAASARSPFRFIRSSRLEYYAMASHNHRSAMPRLRGGLVVSCKMRAPLLVICGIESCSPFVARVATPAFVECAKIQSERVRFALLRATHFSSCSSAFKSCGCAFRVL